MPRRRTPAWAKLPSAEGQSLPPEYYASTPTDFLGVEKLTPGYNMASTAQRERAPVRIRAPIAQRHFAKAHEGPREATAEPAKQYILTPGGKVAYEVHTKEDQQKAIRNRKKDAQMKAWREAKITTARKFNTRAMRPEHLREKVTPAVFRRQPRRRIERRDRER